MANRTDLALECYEEQSATEIDGVEVTEDENLSVVKIFNEKASELLNKPIGTYITYKVPSFVSNTDIFDGRLDELAKQIEELLPNNISGTVLVVGIGNTDITADSLGPKVSEYVLATRHISDDLKKQLGLESLKSVASVATSVLGKTGIETAEIIKGIVNQIKPSCIIAVDALASSSVERLGNTVQISNSGITPGSGVGNHRFEISNSALGVPVVSIGIPTVVASSVMGEDDMSKANEQNELFVTPREIDRVIEHGSRLIGMGINVALQKEISQKDLFALVG